MFQRYSFTISTLKHLEQFIRSFKRNDIYKCCTLISDEPTCLITTSSHVPTRRYSTSARKYKPFLHCTESIKRNDIETFCL